MRQLASPFRLSDTPPTFRRFAPALGEHSIEVLKSIGYSENEIGALEKAGVVRTQNSRS
jgi:crotonobetainyl-CoA:carnitine CoA-transferase CaiB-like acyl-CoA transferase